MNKLNDFGCVDDPECKWHEFVDGVHYCAFYSGNISELNFCGVGDDK